MKPFSDNRLILKKEKCKKLKHLKKEIYIKKNDKIKDKKLLNQIYDIIRHLRKRVDK